MTSPQPPLPLVSRASQGDPQAILQLLEQHLPELRGFLHRHMGRELLAHESSADLVQSVCREVLERLADERVQYRTAAEFKQWLYNAAMFKIRNRLKYWGAARRDAHQEVPVVDASQSQALFQSLWTPSQAASLKENLARFESALARLPGEQQQVIVLSKLEGRSHKEIAEQLGITESHSRVLLTRGLARLARLRDEQES
jgi:RNA polymerase sigma-70 factor (ECF subfamily)